MLKKITALIALFACQFSFAQGNAQGHTFSSASLGGQNIQMIVYTPEGYDENAEPYPVYIFLHGCCGETHTTHWVTIRAALDEMIGNGEIEPLIAVLPNINNGPLLNHHFLHRLGSDQ